ncbi:diaminopimelate decarboxylase [Rickettsiales endosymbiont of Peranema trichophorum]|uniref:diaminopimelate decarboxylase n=1 Tax=Rickettsiales endosymbiont of Peranema trichophorum TaxID=2486577 RepID=UPI0010235321|nr:diaminopimelate decarboxylase [Rickettsiales endosymbiont of Peranema trichophorum]RZI47712.1 diaminopimelate decarboxylase [Rickettsiales endosymbiont of Peranema trichophorum]
MSIRYLDDVLHVENVSLRELVTVHPTPFYCYSTAHIISQVSSLRNALQMDGVLIAYALKANSNKSIVSLLSKLGCGADVVSGWEIRKALDAGITPEKVIFSGVGKTAEEIIYGLNNEVGQFNVESFEELELLNRLAGIHNKSPNVAIRINPDVDAFTHSKITTGLKSSKFGIASELVLEFLPQLKQYTNVRIVGLSMHIGSQISQLSVFNNAFKELRHLVEQFAKFGITITTVDFGGGIGIQYTDEATIDIGKYAELLKLIAGGLNVKVIIEPGRYVVGNSAVLVSKVLYVKKVAGKTILIIDAGMNDFMRVTLYEAVHSMLPVIRLDGEEIEYKVVGPVCESGDFFRESIHLNKLTSGDHVVITGVGAYGYAMSNNYNARPKVAEILVDRAESKVIRRRETYEEYVSLE